MVLAAQKNWKADDNLRSVCYYSSGVISLKIKKGGVFMTITITATAIAKRSKKFMSKDLV